MARKLVISALAEHDVADAYNWYEARSAGLGAYFLRQLDECLTEIRRRPMMFEVVADQFRRALMSKFPFAVFFELSDDLIVVEAVFHCSQDPEKWQNRLRKG